MKKAPPPLPESPVCRVDFNLSDDKNAIAQLMRRTIPSLESGIIPSPHFDLTAVEYLGPFAAAVLLANYLKAKADDKPHTVGFPDGNIKVRAFTHISGLDFHLHGGSPPDEDHPDNVTVPLTIIKKATWNAADSIINLVHRHAVISEDNETYLRNCINEVIQNVEDHAESSFGAVCCARYLLKPQKIRVAIVDCGLGIGTTLIRQHRDIKNTEDALRRVVKGGISAKSRPNNLGIGISNLWGHITKPLQGEIFLITEEVIGYNDAGGNLHTGPLGARFAGTGVFFTVPVAR